MDSSIAPTSSPDGKKHILLIGGGHSNVQVLEMLAKTLHKGDNARITMVSEYQHSYYSGMLPGCVARFYSDADIRMDLKALCEYYGATFVQQRVVELCPKRKLAFLDKGDPISFDVCAINLGSITKVRTRCEIALDSVDFRGNGIFRQFSSHFNSKVGLNF
jgi:NADH dehydrogenase FAD-containing subunit